jgi:hypothetical protein
MATALKRASTDSSRVESAIGWRATPLHPSLAAHLDSPKERHAGQCPRGVP